MRFFHRLFKALPFFSILFIIMVGCTLRIAGYPLLPAFFLIPVYYWLVFRPDWLPMWSLLGIGLFYDALMGNDLGFSSFLLMLSSFVGQYVRAFLRSYHFPLVWGAYALYSFSYLGLYGVVVSGGASLIISWAYGVALYPPGAWVLSHLRMRLRSYG